MAFNTFQKMAAIHHTGFIYVWTTHRLFGGLVFIMVQYLTGIGFENE